MKLKLQRFDRTTVIVTVSALLLAVAYGGLVTMAERVYKTASPTPSVHNDGVAGLSVYYGYLGALGLSPRTLGQFDELPKGATLIAVGPFEVAPTPAETKRLAAWIRSGGRLVVAGPDGRLLLRGLGLSGAPSAAPAKTRLAPVVPSMYAAGIVGIAPGTDRLRPPAPEWVAHYVDDSGAAVLSAAEGRGEVVWLAGADVVANSGIGTADNARLAVLLAAAGRGAIYFDEYHQGYADDASLFARLGSGGQAALLLGVLALVALLVARGRRLGPPLSPRDEPLARSAAYISSLAELYRKAGARFEALESLEDGLARTLARRYGTVEAGLARRPQARAALDASRALRAGTAPGKDDFMTAARTLRRARREVEGQHG